MFTYEARPPARRDRVTATALHPGVVSTGFGAEDPSRIFKFLVPFYRRLMKTPQQGAEMSIYLASSPKVEGITGKYFAGGKARNSNKASYDVAAATRLWRVSADLVGSRPV
jgi:retinol dehydrogenase-14